MLKPLETEFKGRQVALECTHKQAFPPPQMYGSTPEDIDTLWRQGRVDQALYQHLKTWHDACGLMIMGPKCLDCPLALKQNPRPGRPHVIETEPWLAAKDRMRWDDMAAAKKATEAEEVVPEAKTGATEPTPPPKRGFVKSGTPVPVTAEPAVLLQPEPEPAAPLQPELEPELEPEPSFAEMLAEGNTGVTTFETPSEESEPTSAPKAASKPRKAKKSAASRAKNLEATPTEAETSTESQDAGLNLDDDSFLDALADD